MLYTHKNLKYEHFRERIPLGRDTHESVMDLLRQYMVVGGMPQAVAKFAETYSLRMAQECDDGQEH